MSPESSRREPGRHADACMLVLASLAAGPKHGYAMILDIEAFSATVLEPGTLYGALSRLEHRKWIEPLPLEGRRRPYRITPSGLAALRDQTASMSRIVATVDNRLVTA